MSLWFKSHLLESLIPYIFLRPRKAYLDSYHILTQFPIHNVNINVTIQVMVQVGARTDPDPLDHLYNKENYWFRYYWLVPTMYTDILLAKYKSLLENIHGNISMTRFGCLIFFPLNNKWDARLSL